MGLRGRGAQRLKLLRRAAKERGGKTRKEPWEKKGLSREQRVVAFLETLPITKGPLEGTLMKLLPEQLEFIHEIYGPMGRGGLRLRRLGIQSEPKGNGKTGFCSGLILCHMVGPEAETRGEVYSASIDRSMASILFREVEAIILRVDSFGERVNVIQGKKRMEVLSGAGAGTTYEALSSDARKAHGLSPSLFVYDELAQSKDKELITNLIEGLGKRKEALGLIISTQAADDYHPLSVLIDDGLSGADPSTYVQLISAPIDADIYDPEVWRKYNPALGLFLSEKEFEESAMRAQRIPVFEPSFRNLRLNQRIDTDVENRLVPLAVWQAMAVEPRDLEELEGRPCWGALDLSGKHDLSAAVFVFPDEQVPPAFDVYCMFWTPRGQMERRKKQEQDLFKIWEMDGYLEMIPGNVIRYRHVAERLVTFCRRFDVRGIAYDRWRIDDFKAELDDMGEELPLQPFGQGYVDMGPAIESFTEVVLDSRLRHGGHPMLTAAMSSAVTKEDETGAMKLDKRKGRTFGSIRIDGAVCTVMAIRIATKPVDDDSDGPSVYEDVANLFV